MLCENCPSTATEQVSIKKGTFFVILSLKKQIHYLLKVAGDVLVERLQCISASPGDPCYQDVTDGALYMQVRRRCQLSWSDITLTINSYGSPAFKSSK